MAEQAAQSSGDPQRTIDDVVNNVKSEGLFDQFRKECLEEFENMETCHQLKQRVENHVTSFLSKHKYHDGLQKNALRNDLRAHISKSDILLNSIQQLVDEVLSLKGHSFCLRIDKQVDKYLKKDSPVYSSEGVTTADETNMSKAGDIVAESKKVEPVVNNSIIQGVSNDEDKNIENKTTEETEIEEVEMEINDNPDESTGNEVATVKVEEEDAMNKKEGEEKDLAGVEDAPSLTTAVDELGNSSLGSSEEKSENNRDGSLQDGDVDSDSPKTKDDNQNRSRDENGEILPKQSEKKNHKSNCENKTVEETEQITQGSDSMESGTRNDDKTESNEPNVSYDTLHRQRTQMDALSSTHASEVKHEALKDDVQSEAKCEEKNVKLSDFISDIPPLITEPISDDSASNHSSFTEESKNAEIERRKSTRLRSLPLKLREIDGKSMDDNDSVSSYDIEVRDLNERTPRPGRPKLKRTSRQVDEVSDTAETPEFSEKRSRRGRSLTDLDKYRTHKKRDRSVSEEATRGRTRRSRKNESPEVSSLISSRKEDLITSPIDSPDENHSKRARRSVKQRRCYSPS